MNKKIIIILVIVGICLVLTSPVFAKESVKININQGDYVISNKGYIVIKLVDGNGKAINSKGTIYYKITDEHGNYQYGYKSYNGNFRLKYPVGKYKVEIKFEGDKRYKSAEKAQYVTISSSFNPYNYYDDHNWGLDQEIDDYYDYNYWDEEIYDDASNYDGEGY